MHINSFPSLVFRLIFSRLSLHDLLQAGQVCELWKEYQLDITRKLHSVTLLIGVETLYNPTRIAYYRIPADLIAESSFTLHHSNELLNDQGRPLFAQSQRTNVPSATLTNINLYLSTVAQLVASFPNVHTLNIAINGLPCNITQNMIYLLNQWNNKLVTLRLWLNFCRQTDESTWPNLVAKLFKSLNSLFALEHLTLSLYDRTYSPKGLHLDLSILSRLREFNYECATAFDDVSHWMARSGTSAQLQRIGIDGPKDRIHQIASSRFAGKITFLPRNSFYSIRDIVTNLSAFTSLTSFDVNFPFSGNENQSFVELFKSLSFLNQLIHLNLHLNGSLTFFNRISTHKLAQLLSVKLLTVLNDASINFTNLESPHWAWIFPNVQILSVQHDCIRKCTNGDILKCWHLDRFSTPVPLEAIIEGVRILLATFKQCPSLRRIYLNDQLPKYTFQDPHVVLKFNFNL